MKKIILGGITTGCFVLCGLCGLAAPQNSAMNPTFNSVPPVSIPAPSLAKPVTRLDRVVFPLKSQRIVPTSSVKTIVRPVPIATREEIQIMYPVDKSVISQKMIVVKGTTTLKTVVINDARVTVSKKGTFSRAVRLQTGKNIIICRAGARTIRLHVVALPTFIDLPLGHSGKKELESLSMLKYFAAKDKKISPDRSITRAELAVLMTKVAKLPVPPISAKAEALFSDVSPRTVHAPYIYAVTERRLMTGEADGSFQPMKKTSRIEALTVLVRAAQLPIPEQSSGTLWSDVPSGHWAITSLFAAQKAGIIASNGRFYPDRPVTRSEMAVWLSKVPSVKNEIEQLTVWPEEQDQ